MRWGPKVIVTVGLLLLVAASVAYLVAREIGAARTDDASPAPRDDPGTPAAETGSAADEGPDKVIVYYFHGNVRCPTCYKLETYSREAVEQGFAEEILDGLIEWQAVNWDEPENAHVIEEYALVTKAVILARLHGGRRVAWKDLDQIWDRVGGKADFISYVQGETRAFLEHGGD